MEIERRWLMDGFPEDCAAGGGCPPCVGEVEKAQAYLCTAPVVRIRHERAAAADGQLRQSYILCVKGPGTLARQEIETPLSAEVYEQLAALIGVPPIHKRTRLYRLADGHLLECSLVDEGTPGAFYYAEVEFDSLDEAAAFAPPAFLGREKTEDATFSMSAYWRDKCARCAAKQAPAAADGKKDTADGADPAALVAAGGTAAILAPATADDRGSAATGVTGGKERP